MSPHGWVARGRVPVLLLVLLGCSKLKDISQCAGVSCAPGEVCSPLTGECVAASADAGFTPTGCTAASDCRGPQPYCDPISHRCVGCVEDAQCALGRCDAVTRSCAPPPDTCAWAQKLVLSASGEATVTGDTRGLSDDLKAACAVGQGAPDAVYSFTVTGTQRLTATVQPAPGSSLLPVLALRKVCGSSAADSNLGCSFSDPSTGAARLVVDALAPGTYYLWLDADSGSAGAYSLTLKAEVPPPGDSCSSAEPLTFVGDVATVASTTAQASDDASGTCGGAGRDLVYSFTLDSQRRVQLELTPQSSSFLPALYVRRECGSAAGSAQVACQAGSGATQSLDLPNLPAGTYYVFVDGVAGQNGDPTSGAFGLKLTQLPPLPPPVNDRCAGALGLQLPAGGLGVITANGDTSIALSDATSGVCGGAGPDVVYALSLPAGRHVTARVTPTDGASSSYRPVLYLRRPGKCDSELAQDLVACNAAVAAGGSATLDIGNLAAGAYSLWVDGAGSTHGPYTLTVELASPAPPPGNDACGTSTPLPVEQGPVAVTGTTAAANDDASTCQVPAGAPSPDVVYQLDLTAERSLALDIQAAAGSALKPVLALRNAQCASGAPGDQVFCVWADGLFPDRVAFTAGRLPAGRYHLWVDGDYTSVGAFQLKAHVGPPVATPSNEDCAGRQLLQPLATAVVGDTRSASNTTRGVCGSQDGQSGEYAGDVAYAFSLSAARQVTVTVVPDAQDGALFRPIVYVRGPAASSCSSVQPADQVSCAAASTYGGSVVLALGTLAPGDYTVWVDGAGSSRGKFTIAIQ